MMRVTSVFAGGGLPIIAFFQAWEGGVGGALLVFKCAAPLCIDDTDQCVDASVVDESPLWIVSEMQISMVLRPSDGRPVSAVWFPSLSVPFSQCLHRRLSRIPCTKHPIRSTSSWRYATAPAANIAGVCLPLLGRVSNMPERSPVQHV